MQVCWILLAESGDFSENNPLHLIKVKDPKFGKSENIPVNIDTSLPRIIRLKEEVQTLKKDLIPAAIITISKPGLTIGDIEIQLPPMGLTYYRYFAERVLNGGKMERFMGYNTTKAFLNRIIEIHAEFYPNLDSHRMDLEDMRKKDIGLSLSTFRGNVSKTNKNIKKEIDNETIYDTFHISIEGPRGAKFYGIKAPKEKISLVQ